jgi:glycosyltransferase involved in cell wall biosynthesis
VPVAALALNARMPFPKRLPPELAGVPQLTWNPSGALRQAMEEGPILYHVFAPFEDTAPWLPWLPPQVGRNDVPLVVSVYDLIPEVMGYLWPGSRDERFFRLRCRMLAHADLLLAISEQTRRDVIERLGVHGDRVCVVGAGCSDYFRPPRTGESPDAVVREHLPAIDRPFVLMVSAWDTRKNTELLIDAFSSLPHPLRDSLQLVVVCSVPADWRRAWSDRARARGLRTDDVVLTGFTPGPVLRALYQQTTLFAYPSRYEGFGLPVVEAGRCGAPAVVADAPGLREVGPWRPAQFDPDDAEALAALIERGVSDTPFRSRLLELTGETARRHTWSTSPGARSRRTSGSTRRCKIAGSAGEVGHPCASHSSARFPLLARGVAQYNAAVAAHLAERCELDCFVDAADWSHRHVADETPAARVQAVGPRRPTGPRARWLPAPALGRRVDPARYDAILYALGNSWYHHETLMLARRSPGTAWLHDVDLTGLYITYAHRLLARDPKEAAALFEDVLRRYGARAPAVQITESLEAWALYEPYRRAGIHFAVEVAGDAAACLVPQQAAQMLELDAGPPELLPPIQVLPLGVPPARRRSNSDGGVSTVVSLGCQDFAAKRPEILLEAMAIALRARRARLALVGRSRRVCGPSSTDEPPSSASETPSRFSVTSTTPNTGINSHVPRVLSNSGGRTRVGKGPPPSTTRSPSASRSSRTSRPLTSSRPAVSGSWRRTRRRATWRVRSCWCSTTNHTAPASAMQRSRSAGRGHSRT